VKTVTNCCQRSKFIQFNQNKAP